MRTKPCILFLSLCLVTSGFCVPSYANARTYPTSNVVKASAAKDAKKAYKSILKNEMSDIEFIGYPQVVKYADINGDKIPEMTVHYENGLERIFAYDGWDITVAFETYNKTKKLLYNKKRHEVVELSEDSCYVYDCSEEITDKWMKTVMWKDDEEGYYIIEQKNNPQDELEEAEHREVDSSEYNSVLKDIKSGAVSVKKAASDGIKVYDTTCSNIKSIQNSNGNLIVKFDRAIEYYDYNSASKHKTKKIKSLKLKQDPDIKWGWMSVDYHNSVYRKSNFTNIKKTISEIRTSREWEAGFRIFVKNNKIIRVCTVSS